MLTLSKNKKKLFASLKYAKYRQKYNIYLVEGEKTAYALFEQENPNIEHIIVTESWMSKHTEFQEHHRDKILIAEPKDIKELSAFKTPSEIILVLKMEVTEFNIMLINGTKSIYLDEVQDPGNVGAILRIADWYGIKNVIRSSNSADFYNSKTLQSSMGSFSNLNLLTQDFELFSDQLKVPSIATALDGEALPHDLSGDFLLIMGNEGNGVKKSILNMVDRKVKIPGAKGRVAESLNVAVATGIVCHLLTSKS